MSSGPPAGTDETEPPIAGLFGGRYRLGGLLGVGGSASVYEAEDVEGRVALKILHPHLCADEQLRAAFLREARYAERLSHPNVVSVRGSGEHEAGGVPLAWIALDLVEGPTLLQWVGDHGPLSPTEAGAVLAGLLAGLGAAHGQGIVHRDVSPRNVILDGATAGGPVTAAMVRLLDFGLAGAAGLSTVGSNLLLAGPQGPGSASGDGGDPPATVVGSAAYLSPEQASGRPVTAAGDLYQSGAVLYFLLTGQPPYPRRSVGQVLEAHLSAPPPVPSALEAAARSLDRVVTRAMAKEPARRYADAPGFAAALDQALAAPAGGRTSAVPTRVMPLGEYPAAMDYLGSGPLPGPAVRSVPVAAARTSTGSWSGTDSSAPGPTASGSATGSGVGAARAGAGPGSGAQLSPTPGSSGGVAAAVTLMVVAGVAVAAVMSASGSPAPPAQTPLIAPTTANSTAAPVTSPPSAPPSPTEFAPPAEVTVPALRGSLGEAVAELRSAGLTLGVVTQADSPEPTDRVLGQSPVEGQLLPEGDPVDVVVASGWNAVPEIDRLTLPAAIAALEAAGFVVATDRPEDGIAGVEGSSPAAGTVIPVGSVVTLLLTPAPPASPSETPTNEPSTGSGSVG